MAKIEYFSGQRVKVNMYRTVYIGIAMVFVFSPYIREIQFLLSVSSQSVLMTLQHRKCQNKIVYEIFH